MGIFTDWILALLTLHHPLDGSLLIKKDFILLQYCDTGGSDMWHALYIHATTLNHKAVKRHKNMHIAFTIIHATFNDRNRNDKCYLEVACRK